VVIGFWNLIIVELKKYTCRKVGSGYKMAITRKSTLLDNTTKRRRSAPIQARQSLPPMATRSSTRRQRTTNPRTLVTNVSESGFAARDMDCETVVKPSRNTKLSRCQPDSEPESEYSEVDSEDELPKFEYESRYSDSKDPFELEGPNTDLPVVHLPVVHLPVVHLTETAPCFKRFNEHHDDVGHERWPINQQDDSTTFSVLVKSGPKNPPRILPKLNVAIRVAVQPEPKKLSDPEPSIEDFLDYESAAGLTEDDESDCSSAASSPPMQGASLATTPWNSNIPICGYRNRNSVPTLTPPNQVRFMAALSSMAVPDGSSVAFVHPESPLEGPLSTVYYQQAVIAANGLNRRSLLYGKAQQMVSGGMDELV
jgi:hypothetical protein